MQSKLGRNKEIIPDQGTHVRCKQNGTGAIKQGKDRNQEQQAKGNNLVSDNVSDKVAIKMKISLLKARLLHIA